jgi:hypothetical protein
MNEGTTMYKLTNIPHSRDKTELDVRIKDGSIKVVVVDPKPEKRDEWYGVCDLYIGDHLFEKPEDLRMMVGRALITAIYQARDVGYRQAQRDIRYALGLSS